MGDPARLLRRALPYVSAVALAAVLYDGWVFYTRWSQARHAAQAQKDAEVRRARETIDLMGGTDFRIISFYPYPASIKRGETARICFGVYGAKELRIEPPVEKLRPAMNNCIQVSPRESTDYKLIAEDGKGHAQTAALRITVH